MPQITTTTYLTLLMGIAVAIFAVLFLPLSLRLDEAQSLWQTSHSIGSLLGTLSKNVHVPLYHILLHEWQSLFGNSVLSARLLSLLFFLASIPALYGLSRYVYGRAVGLSAATFFAISPFMNWFSSETRMYTLLVLLTIASHYTFLRLLKNPTPATWGLYGAVAVVGIYTHYFFGLLLLSQGLFYLINYKKYSIRAFWFLFSTAALLVLAISPWLYLVFNSGAIGEASALLARPTTIDFFNVFSNFFFGFQTDYVNSMLLSLWPFTVLFSFLALRNHKAQPRPETWYFFTTIVVPMTIALLISLFLQPVFLSRYLILTLPALLILTSRVISLYSPSIRAWSHALVGILMLSTLALQALNPQVPANEDYKAVSMYLNQHARAQDIIVVSAPFTIYPVNYYYDGPARIITMPSWNRYAGEAMGSFSVEEANVTAENLKGSYQRVWLLLSYDQGYESEVKRAFDERYLRLEAHTIGPRLALYSYKLRHDVDYKENYLTSGSSRSSQAQ